MDKKDMFSELRVYISEKIFIIRRKKSNDCDREVAITFFFFSVAETVFHKLYIYIYSFSRHFYPKWLSTLEYVKIKNIFVVIFIAILIK